jgi:hypothetical protein
LEPTNDNKTTSEAAAPPEQRLFMAVARGTAVQIGCSPATIHRLGRGEIDGVPRLPAVQVGKRKGIVLKDSLEQEGITLSTAFKKVPDPILDLWLVVASLPSCIGAWTQNIDQQFGPSEGHGAGLVM